MQLYLAHLELHGLLVLAEEVRSIKVSLLAGGPLIRSSKFIHNYTLMYALSPIPEAPYGGYLGFTDKPSYKLIDDLKKEKLLYAYPAQPLDIRLVRVFTASKPETLCEVRGRPKIGHPFQVHYIAVAPGSKYKTIILCDENIHLPRYVRLGKKRWGIVKLTYHPLMSMERVKPRYSTVPVNIGDMREFGVKIENYITVATTRNHTHIGEKASIGYVKANPTYKLVFRINGKTETVYTPIPEHFL